MKIYIETTSHFTDNSDDITRVSVKPIEARETGPYSASHIKEVEIPDSEIIEALKLPPQVQAMIRVSR